MSCTDVVTENCDDADLFVSLDTRDLEQADLIELVANATLRYVKHYSATFANFNNSALLVGLCQVICSHILGGPRPPAGSEAWPRHPP